MTTLPDAIATGLLGRLDPERAHGLTLRMLALGLAPRWRPATAPPLAVTAFGLDFPSPIGVAAGFDKNAAVPDALLAMGFGFVEVGTVTPRPQAGNPRPRVFRSRADGAVVNRLGFNNAGLGVVRDRLAARRGRSAEGIVGVNIGANRDSADRAADYARGYAAFAPLADYVTVNVSSPNTPGLRDLQAEAALDDLLAALDAARDAAAKEGRAPPLLVKVAPDLDEGAIDTVAATVRRHAVDGLVVSNTTVTRPPGIAPALGAETGGLSGRPLFRKSTVALARFARALDGAIPLVGVGGVSDGESAFQKIAAGATLVQLYTGLVFGGPGLVRRLHANLAAALAARGFASPAEAVGALRDDWAAMPLGD